MGRRSGVNGSKRRTSNIECRTSNGRQQMRDISFSIERWTLSVERLLRMSDLDLTTPLTFRPIFMERIWGARRIETEFGKKLPPNVKIGESWEIVDRPEAQSIVARGPVKGKTLHHLWTQHRDEIFEGLSDAPRFPLLLKLIDAQEKLSLQVHPPEKIAAKLGSEPKTEFWYVAAAADPDA